MKKLVFVILFVTMLVKGLGQTVTDFSYHSSVDLYGLFEISFCLSTTYNNPYNPDTINIYAIFTDANNNSYTVNAFYYEEYTFQQINGYEEASHNASNDGWRIRFTPNTPGTWSFVIRAFDKTGELNLPLINSSHSFNCNSVRYAEGFISMANRRFLRREIINKGNKQFRSFFPIGPNVPFYRCLDYCTFQQPRGIYYYEDHIDSLYNNANYMRIWVNIYQYLSLIGPEYTPGGTVYFDSIVNQKDSAELDHIITYASQHNVSIMLSMFNSSSFRSIGADLCNYNNWTYNPYNTIMHLCNPCMFFSDTEAIRITKNLIRYIISRWGYATNIMCWELWNEVDLARQLCTDYDDFDQDVLDWHDEMSSYIRNIDPFGHCISSSLGGFNGHPSFATLFPNLDFVQLHIYQSIQRANSRFSLPYSLYIRSVYAHNNYQLKPSFIGEFGFSHRKPPHSEEKDPKGIALHNSLWSSLFSTSIGPASLWWCYYIDSCALYKHFTPLMNFCQKLPVLSGTFRPHTTGHDTGAMLMFSDGIGTYYMSNADEDTIMGWCQDTAFAYQSLRWLTDSVRIQEIILPDTILPPLYFRDTVPPFDSSGYVYTLDPSKRPGPSSNSNLITLPITNQSVGKRYILNWYNSETGSQYNMTTYGIPIQQDAQGHKYISFLFPSFIRDLKKNTINNTFGDAVFILYRYDDNPSQKQSY